MLFRSEELWKKKQQEEQEEQAREKVLQGALASQEEGLVHFKAQWEAIQPDLKKARQLDVQIQSQQSSYIQSQQILQAANRQVAEQEQKMRVAAEQLQVSYSSLNRLLSHVGIEEALQLEQVEEILRQEESKLAAATSTNEERLLRLNSFGYPLLAEEQEVAKRVDSSAEYPAINGNADESKDGNRKTGERSGQLSETIDGARNRIESYSTSLRKCTYGSGKRRESIAPAITGRGGLSGLR